MSFSNFNRDVTVSLRVDIRDLEAAFARAGLMADETGKKIGDSFTEGTSKAAEPMHRLSQAAASWGIPFATTLDNIGTKFDQATSKAQKFSGVMSDAGKLTLVAGAVGFATASYEALKLGTSFQSTVAKIQGSAQITSKAAQSIGNAFLDTSGKSVFSGQEIASAYANVAGVLGAAAGHALNAGQALRFMDVAGQLAEATGQSLSDSTSALAGTMQSWGLKMTQTTSTANILFNASRTLNLPIAAVSQAVDRLHGRLGILAPSLTDVGALMVEMGHLGITGQRGIMAINSSFQTLAGTSAKTHSVLKTLGVDVYNSQGQFVGLASIISQLQPKFAAMTQQQQIYVAQTLFGKQAGQAMLAVIQQGVGVYEQESAAVQKHNALASAATAQEKTLHDQLEILRATVIDLATKFGTFLIPKLEELGQWLSNGIQWMEKHRAAAETLAIVIGGVLGAAVATFITGKMISFVTWLGNGVKAVGGLAQAIYAGATRMVSSFTSIGAGSQTMAGEVAAADTEMTAATDTAAANIDAALTSTGIGAAIVAVGIAAAELETHWSTAWNNIKSITASIVNGIVALINQVIGSLNQLIGLYNSTIGRLLGSIGQIGALGGVNFGGGGSQYGAGQYNTPGGGIGGGSSFGGFQLVRAGGAGQNNLVANAASAYGVPANILWGVYGIESSFGHNMATSSAGAMGGFQFTSPTKAGVHLPGPYPMTNRPSPGQFQTQAQDAAAYLAYLYHHNGNNWNAALEAYSGGGYGLAQVLGMSGQGGGVGRAGTGAGIPGIQGLINAAGKGKGAASIKSLLYQSPLAGAQYTVERTDQGKDFGAVRGNIGAIGAGIITLAQSLSGFGQTIVEKLTQGPNAGQSIYYGLETGAMPVGVRAGQRVGVGQTLARGLGTGGVELGFWNPRTGRSEGAPYFSGSNATPPGTAFANWMAALAKGSTYLTSKGGVVTGGGANYGYTIAQLEQAFYNALVKSADATIQKFANAIQNGTTRTLTDLLGVGTGGKTTTNLFRDIEGRGVSPVLTHMIAGENSLLTTIHTRLAGTLNRAINRSPQGRAFYQQVGNVAASGNTSLAEQLLSWHKAAINTLAETLYAEQKTKDGESLNLQATSLKDEAQKQSNYDNALLQVQKAQEQKVVDSMSAIVTAIKDMAQLATDQFAGMVQAIQDAATSMKDAMDSLAQGIADQTQVQVDILGERGLYGLNLVAQKLQVVEDQTKAYWDQQIALAQKNLDSVTSVWHAQVNAAQIAVDQTQIQEDQRVALAQNHLDTVTVIQDQRIAEAQRHADSVQLHEDTAVIGPAQIAVDLNANAPKSAQNVFTALLKVAQGKAGVAEGQAGVNLANVTYGAQSLIQGAQNTFDAIQGDANKMIANAQANLANITGDANVAIANAQDALTQVQGTAEVAEAKATSAQQIAAETAATEFTGTGTVINIYGIPTEDAAGIANEVSWVARAQLS